MELQGDVGHVESHFGPFGDSVRCQRKIGAWFVLNVPHPHKSFWSTRQNFKVTWVMWNLILVHLEIVLVLVQDRCSVCAKHTVGSEIVLDAPDSSTS
jgi:hypothetical protein